MHLTVRLHVERLFVTDPLAAHSAEFRCNLPRSDAVNMGARIRAWAALLPGDAIVLLIAQPHSYSLAYLLSCVALSSARIEARTSSIISANSSDVGFG